MSDLPRFPNLFIIGAMKAGTSSLHEYLHQHPQIYMSRFKEPQYFAPHRIRYGMWGQGNPLPEPGIHWYLRLFKDAGNAKYAGESSVTYTARHWLSGCEQRIWEFNRESKIIYLMRDPVERAISHYWHFVAAGRETLGPENALRQRELDDYVARSDYAYQIEPYFQRFGRENVYPLTLEELQRDPDGTFRELFRWLGVDESVSIDTGEKHNVRCKELRQPRRFCQPLVHFLRGWRWQKWKTSVPEPIIGLLERAVYRNVDRSRVDLWGATEYLRQRLLPRVEVLSRLLRREFRDWTTLYRDPRVENNSAEMLHKPSNSRKIASPMPLAQEHGRV